MKVLDWEAFEKQQVEHPHFTDEQVKAWCLKERIASLPCQGMPCAEDFSTLFPLQGCFICILLISLFAVCFLN